MKRVERTSLVAIVASRIRKEIEDGRMGDEIPSCRDLAARLDVSPPVTLAALRQLAAEGWLIPGKARRPYRVAARQEAGSTPERRLLILSSAPVVSYNSYTRATVKRLMLECTADGWEIKQSILEFKESRQPGRRWDELVTKYRPTHLVALMGTPVLARWARKLGLPAFFIGGSPGDTTVPAVGISLSGCVRRLLPDFLGRGHLHFSLPVCGYPEAYLESIRRACREELEKRGLTFVPAYHTPCRPHANGDAVRSALHEVFATRVPSALIFTRIDDYLAALGLLQRHRLMPGKDLSITVLTHDDLLDWMDPRPAHFVYPTPKYWRIVKSWLRDPASPRFNRGSIHLPATFVPETGSTERGARSGNREAAESVLDQGREKSRARAGEIPGSPR